MTRLVDEAVPEGGSTYPWCIVCSGTRAICKLIALRRIGVVNELRGPAGRLLNVRQASRGCLELLPAKVGLFSSSVDVAVNCAFEVGRLVEVESVIVELVIEVGEH